MRAVSQTPKLLYPGWGNTAPANSPAPGAVHVWRASLDAHQVHAGRLITFLSPDELKRAGRFHFERDQSRYSIGRGVLRLLIGRYLGRPPGAISFTYTLRAKPCLPSPETLAFNLSHSHGKALYAFGYRSELGIDIEKNNAALEVAELARNFFTPEEVRFVLQEPLEARRPAGVDDRNERFFFLWSRKEAYIKARAEGLHLPLNEFDVANRSTLDGFELQSFVAWPQFAAALAVKPRPSEILFFDFDSSGFAL